MNEKLSQLIDFSVYKATEIDRAYFTNKGKKEVLKLLREHQKVLNEIIEMIENESARN